MKHEVGRSVIMNQSGSDAVNEFSRAVSLQTMNGAQFEAWFKYATPFTAPTLKISLEGSNDLAQWTDLGVSTTFSGTALDYDAKQTSGTVPWQFVRLRYVLTGLGPFSVAFATSITTFEEA